jgi:hypothetical protein
MRRRFSQRTVEEIDKSLVSAIPMKRLGTSDEIAETVTFLASRDTSYDDRATLRSKSTLRFSAMTKPSTPSRRRTELNSERCTATWLIVPSR